MRVEDLKVEGSNVRLPLVDSADDGLVESIRAHGVLLPLVVRVGENGLEVLDGGRRLRAAVKAGVGEVPVVFLDGAEAAGGWAAWVCNFEREAVPFLDEACWMGRVVPAFQDSPERLAMSLGRSPGYVRSRLAVLEWPPLLLEYCATCSISYSVAREYARLGVSVELERAIDWDKINGPSYRQAVAYVDEILRARELPIPAAPVEEADVAVVSTCDACGGERDPRTSRALLVCAECVAGLLEVRLGSDPVGDKPKTEGRARRGGGGRNGATRGKADGENTEGAAGAN